MNKVQLDFTSRIAGEGWEGESTMRSARLVSDCAAQCAQRNVRSAMCDACVMGVRFRTQRHCGAPTISYIRRVFLRLMLLVVVTVSCVGACSASQVAAPEQPSDRPPSGAVDGAAAASGEESIEVLETCSKRIADLGTLGGGLLPRSEVRKSIRLAQPRFDDCLSKANARGAQLNGTLAFSFVVGGDGRVVSAWADEEVSTVTDAAFTCCVVRAVERVVFPEPRGGTVVGRYSLNLRNESVAARTTKPSDT